MLAQDAVELGPHPFDGTAALLVENVGPELDREAVERVEGMRQQKQLGLGVNRRSLDAARIPCTTDFDPRARKVDMR